MVARLPEGATEMRTSLIKACCVCDCTRSGPRLKNGLSTRECKRCGNAWQDVHMDQAELSAWYATQYMDGVYTHSFEEDMVTAQKRAKAYKLSTSKQIRILDVGSGNGAFVAEARKLGHDAYGCEIAKDSDANTPYIYKRDLFDVHFPTDFFDMITLHDSLEHLVNPKKYLVELFRSLCQGGQLIVEVPNFHVEAGKKDWKSIEHLWLFRERDVKEMLQDVGFTLSKVCRPVKWKLVFYVTKPKQNRIKIMVPPGIGDIYWSMIKMEAFLKQNELGIPDIHIFSAVKRNGERDRSIDYVRRLPFVNAAGYEIIDSLGPIWDEAYRRAGRTLFTKVGNCDYFMAYNGVMRYGLALDDVDRQWETNWLTPMFCSYEEAEYGRKLKEAYGNYIVGYFMPHGMYRYWLAEFSVDEIRKSLHMLAEQLNAKVLLIGAKWDEGLTSSTLMEKDPKNHFVDLVGKTSLPECFGLLHNANAVVGFPSGITIMSTVFRTPTVMLWNSYFNKRFYWNSCPPQSRDNWYDVTDTGSTSPSIIVDKALTLVANSKVSRIC